MPTCSLSAVISRRSTSPSRAPSTLSRFSTPMTRSSSVSGTQTSETMLSKARMNSGVGGHIFQQHWLPGARHAPHDPARHREAYQATRAAHDLLPNQLIAFQQVETDTRVAEDAGNGLHDGPED